ncbi:MAG: nucleotidyltransferase domain-containing protein [Candidatus Woesearchaeota archaeon]
MGKPSKEEDVLKLFFEEPTKHWHFTEIKSIVKIADNKVSRWLNEFVKMKLIKKIKPQNKMPYYISNYENSNYQNLKKFYAIKKFQNSGFFNHLLGLDAKSIVLFGSFSRWDWYKNSDIDLFIYGDDKHFEKSKYEKILNHEIQVFNFKNKSQLKKIPKELMHNIIQGNLIKGNLDFLEVNVIG